MPDETTTRHQLWCKHCHAVNTESGVPTVCPACRRPTHWLMTKPLSLFTRDDWFRAKIDGIRIDPEDLPD